MRGFNLLIIARFPHYVKQNIVLCKLKLQKVGLNPGLPPHPGGKGGEKKQEALKTKKLPDFHRGALINLADSYAQLILAVANLVHVAGEVDHLVGETGWRAIFNLLEISYKVAKNYVYLP